MCSENSDIRYVGSCEHNRIEVDADVAWMCAAAYAPGKCMKCESKKARIPRIEPISWDLSSTCKVSVMDDNGKKLVDIREYIPLKMGSKKKPAKDGGVSFSLQEYIKVKRLVNTIDAELAECSDGTNSGDGVCGWHKLSEEHTLRVGNFRDGDLKIRGVALRVLKRIKTGGLQLSSSQELIPTGKGITLSVQLWNEFKDLMPEIEEKGGLKV